jgi:membrane-bound lytic murein transglycosylase B
MKALQQHLNLLGFLSGKPDGIWGPKSRKGIKQFQLKEGLIADGYPNKEVFLALQNRLKNTSN